MTLSKKTKIIAENVPKVYEAGVKTGKTAEYDRFWDTYQDKGNPKDYSCAFANASWTTEFFKPKYDIIATNAYMIFRGNQINADLVEYLADLGIKLDISKAVNTQYMFNNTAFTRIGVVDIRSSGNSVYLDGAFSNSRQLVTIDKIILKPTENKSQFASTFNSCTSLENITIEGEIDSNGLDLSTCTKLSHESLMSVIDALKNGVSGLTCTLGATNLAKLTDAEKAIATNKGWVLK